MMEMIRSWRIPLLPAIGHAAFARMRKWRVGRFLGWSALILFVGTITGAMTVLFPPMASIGMVAVIGVILLWAMPDLPTIPDKLLRRMFFLMVAVLLCIPNYYAIDTGILPWISVRRFFIGAVILLFCITIAGSKDAREKVVDAVESNQFLSFLTLGFLAMLVISLFTANVWVVSLNGLVDSLLTWYVPIFACILVVRTADDVIVLLKIMACALVWDTLLGVIEFFVQRRYYFDIFPQSVLQNMLASNPALEIIYNTVWIRNGIYRSSSIYTVPLSFGELAAVVAPIGAYFIFHGQNAKWRVVGLIAIIASFVALIISGSRGGFISFLAAMPIMLALWVFRSSKIDRRSMMGAVMGCVFLAGTIAVMTLVVAWPRASNIVFGGGETAGSTDARFVQWRMAVPHILNNPITGHGKNSSTELVGYYNPGSPLPTLDSYVISLLVEQGIPGFLLFFGMIAFGVWIGIRLYLTRLDDLGALGAPIACSLIAFSVYRLALSQTENHTLMFLILGLVFAVARLSSKAELSPLKNPPYFRVPGPGPRLTFRDGWNENPRSK
jgi:O-antigen ligase